MQIQTPLSAPLGIELAREQMVDQQLRTWEVLDARVLDAVLAVRREVFVPQAYRDVAFADAPIPLGHGQCMLPPKIDGRILQALAIQPSDRILDVGTGSGFLAACMGRLGAHVRSVEVVADLAERAKANLLASASNNVAVDTVDATTLTDEDRYEAIAVTASVPPNNDALEQRFARALKVGGRLFMVVGTRPVMEALVLTRVTASHWRREPLFETVIEPLVNAVRPSSFVF
jgi:protein-L-isoaspartate(D-aspartate) O-methyltransferase